MPSKAARFLVVVLLAWLLWAAFVNHDVPTTSGLGIRPQVTSVTMKGDREHTFKCYSAGPDKHRKCYRIK